MPQSWEKTVLSSPARGGAEPMRTARISIAADVAHANDDGVQRDVHASAPVHEPPCHAWPVATAVRQPGAIPVDAP